MRVFHFFLLVFSISCGTASDSAQQAGHDSASKTDSNGSPVSAANYCVTVADGYCDFYLRCGRIAAQSPGECHAMFLNACESTYQPRYQGLETAGLLTLFPPGVDACMAHLATVECDAQLHDLDGPCGMMWQGHQPVGGDCAFDVESLVCEPGSICVLDLSLCGQCRPVAGLGQPCGEGTACESGQRCDGVCKKRGLWKESCDAENPCAPGYGCEKQICAPRSQVVAVGESCDETRRCPYGAHCNSTVCEKNLSVGETCTDTSVCEAGFCENQLCQSYLVPGSACSDGSQCQSGMCQDVCLDNPSQCFAAE